MKRADIDRLRSDAMISDVQHAAIITRYSLDNPPSRLGILFAMIGAAMCLAGVALVISANWAALPRLLKLAAAVALLVSLHAGGALATRRTLDGLAAALHVAGSGMFLLCIALVGQVYNLSARPPNALVLWMLGIALLPWLLQSRAQFVLWLLALVAWLVMESHAPDSPLHLRGMFGALPVVAAWIGSALLALGAVLARAPGPGRPLRFGDIAQFCGVVLISGGLLACVLGWDGMGRADGSTMSRVDWATLPLWLSAASLLLLLTDMLPSGGERIATRIAWPVTIGIAVALPWAALVFPSLLDAAGHWRAAGPFVWVASAVLFALALLQVQRGVARNLRALVNAGILFVALNAAAVYARLFGNMMDTGIMFVATGVLLVLLAWRLERWRRRLNQRIGAEPAPTRHG